MPQIKGEAMKIWQIAINILLVRCYFQYLILYNEN